MTDISNCCDYYAAVATSLYKRPDRPFTPTNIAPFYTRFIYATLTSRVSRIFVSSSPSSDTAPKIQRGCVGFIYVKRFAVCLAGVWQPVPLVKSPENNQSIYESRRIRLLIRERLYLFYSETEVFGATAPQVLDE